MRAWFGIIGLLIASPAYAAPSLGVGIATATLMGCATKKIGQKATQDFYTRMQAVGKHMQAACDARRDSEARSLLIATLKREQASPAVAAILGCYETNKAFVHSAVGPAVAPKLSQYLAWVEAPNAAEKQMQNSDVCVRKQKQENL
jgi:hypothetical protein